VGIVALPVGGRAYMAPAQRIRAMDGRAAAEHADQFSPRLTIGDLAAASAVEYARRLRPPMKLFAYELRRSLGLPSLSRQTLYEWESARARVPASVLIAAARLSGVSVDELLRRSARAGSRDFVNP
jgi:hypothetical protein